MDAIPSVFIEPVVAEIHLTKQERKEWPGHVCRHGVVEVGRESWN